MKLRPSLRGWQPAELRSFLRTKLADLLSSASLATAATRRNLASRSDAQRLSYSLCRSKLCWVGTRAIADASVSPASVPREASGEPCGDFLTSSWTIKHHLFCLETYLLCRVRGCSHSWALVHRRTLAHVAEQRDTAGTDALAARLRFPAQDVPLSKRWITSDRRAARHVKTDV